MSGVTWTPIHISSLLTQFITHTHTQKQCSLYNPKSPAPRSSPKLSPRSNSDPPSPTRRWLTAKVRFGREILFLREELITTTKRRHDESSPSLDWITAKRKFFLHRCVFSRGSIVFFSFRFPPSKFSARALARALFRLSFSRVKESKSARGSKKTKRGERREPFLPRSSFRHKKDIEI